MKIKFSRWPNQDRHKFRFELAMIIGRRSIRLSVCRWPFLYDDDKIHFSISRYCPGLGFSNEEATRIYRYAEDLKWR